MLVKCVASCRVRSALLLAHYCAACVWSSGVRRPPAAAGLSLVYVVFRLSRPAVGELGRDPRSGAWGWLDRHPGWAAPRGTLVIRSDGQLLYPNVDSVRERVLEAVAAATPPPEVVVLDLSQSVDLDLQSVDGIADLARQLGAQGVELRLAAVRAPAGKILQRAGVTPGVPAFPTVSAAVDGAVSQARPLIASPISLVPMIKHNTAMITTFSLAIRAHEILDGLKSWMAKENVVIMYVLVLDHRNQAHRRRDQRPGLADCPSMAR